MIHIGRVAVWLSELVIATIVTVAMPGAVQACQQWDVGRVPSWYLAQSNDTMVYVTFQQHGTKIGGSASWKPTTFGNDPGGTGTVAGSINGNVLTFTTSWGGFYKGWIHADGTMNGNTHDVHNRNSRAVWTAKFSHATCLQ